MHRLDGITGKDVLRSHEHVRAYINDAWQQIERTWGPHGSAPASHGAICPPSVDVWRGII